jgi:ribosomal 50S subunit-recycling heat shock protein
VDKFIKENKANVQALQETIAEAMANLDRIKLDNAKARSAADVTYNSALSSAEKDRAQKLELNNAKYQTAASNVNQCNAEQPWKFDGVTKTRYNTRAQFMSAFGDVERNI